MKDQKKAFLIHLLKKEVKPALGCTEPVSVALASTKAREILGEFPQTIEVTASGNIIKNGMGVNIPGTCLAGLHFAAALGAITGNSKDELEVLKNLTKADIEKAKQFVKTNPIPLKRYEGEEILYVQILASTKNHNVRVILSGSHTHISLIEKDKQVLFRDDIDPQRNMEEKSHKITLGEIFEFCSQENLENIRSDVQFIFDGAILNDKISHQGLKEDYGIQVGKNLSKNVEKGFLSDDISTYATMRASAASDARMAGVSLPVMSNSGSGNQGITISVPITAIGKKQRIQKETVERALLLGNLVAIYLKTFTNKLSAFCGAVSASIGASAGITYMLGGSFQQVEYSIKNMIASTPGMICDGAKPGCALKVSTSVNAAVQSALLAVQGLSASQNDGIVEDDVEKTLKNIENIATNGMMKTDEVIFDILTYKGKRKK
jgi:L-cysteine desulfidase